MAYLQIPITNDSPAYTFQTLLEGVNYTLEFLWNTRGAYWTMGIYDSANTPLVIGVRLITGWDLFGDYVNLSLPPGKFYLFDSGGENKDPDELDFGTRILLIYRESTTVDE